MPHPKHEQVRARYKGHCGYCGVSEIDAGGELTVDHYRPTTAGGEDEDDNLVYACSRCNLYMADFYPGPVDIARGCRVLHPLLDDVPSHFRLNQASGDLEPLTVTGRFHIALLRLNRPLLVQYRIRQRLAELLAERVRLLEAENSHLQATCAKQEEYLDNLRRLLQSQTPPDQS